MFHRVLYTPLLKAHVHQQKILIKIVNVFQINNTIKTKVIPVISGAPAIKLQHNQQTDLI